jgi:hypothetical protein
MMSSPSDIKPTIAGDSTPRPDFSPLLDIQPSITNFPKNGNPIDLTKHKHSILEERRKLEEEFRLRRTVLDLREESLQDKEEISRLKASLRVAKVEPGDRDIKPDISESRGDHGGRSDDPAGQSHRLEESDDDDILFIREVKAKTRRIDRDEFPGESHCSPRRHSADFSQFHLPTSKPRQLVLMARDFRSILQARPAFLQRPISLVTQSRRQAM